MILLIKFKIIIKYSIIFNISLIQNNSKEGIEMVTRPGGELASRPLHFIWKSYGACHLSY